MNHDLPTPLGVIPVPALIAIAVVALLLLMAAAVLVGRRIGEKRRIRRVNANAAEIRKQRRRTPPAGVLVAGPDQPAPDPGDVAALVEARRAMWSGLDAEAPARRGSASLPSALSAGLRRFPLPDAAPAPFDELVSTPRVASPGNLFDPPTVTLHPETFRSGSWAHDTSRTGAAGAGQ